MKRILTSTLAVMALMAAPALGQLSVTPQDLTAGSNEKILFDVQGCEGSIIAIVYGPNLSTTTVPGIGTFDVDLATASVMTMGVMTSNGISLECQLECSDPLLNTVTYFQVIAINADLSICGVTPLSTMTLTDAFLPDADGDGIPDTCEAPVCLVVIDEDTIDNGIHSIDAAAASHGVLGDWLVNDDQPTEVGNPPLKWNEFHSGDIVLLPGGEVDDEGIFALPSSTSFTVEDFALGNVPQSKLDKIADVMPLRDQDLYSLIGTTCVAVVYDSDISMNFKPLNANLQGARYGLFTFTVLGVEVPHHIPEATSSTSLYSLWVRVEKPMMPTVNATVTVHDHEPDSIQVTGASYSGGVLTVTATSNFGSSSLMTISIDGIDGGSDLAVDPLVLEKPMTFNPAKGQFEFSLVTSAPVHGRRLKIATDHGGADNIFIK